ncbi:hypothetical protein ABNB56_07160 [Streptococcus iniae]|uniref:hypothetical protein n=1 Tax=Streptococcus iniae TaxID=1346 RepID=UPI000EFC668B|nr:hypothetical protein [Streptococcus iniae]RMI79767.1 hypothetical protein DIX58_00800 [Streptococcus iniae]
MTKEEFKKIFTDFNEKSFEENIATDDYDYFLNKLINIFIYDDMESLADWKKEFNEYLEDVND